ncbi:MAG: hypothetical protein JNJ69_09940, partial [Leptospiraceae bacterium]|nr:hypothetical protein [Leptospiraceae bacterium]
MGNTCSSKAAGKKYPAVVDLRFYVSAMSSRENPALKSLIVKRIIHTIIIRPPGMAISVAVDFIRGKTLIIMMYNASNKLP